MMQKCKGGTPHLVWNSDTRTYEPDGTWEQNEKGLYKGAELLSRLLDKLDGAAEDEGADDYEKMLTGGSREF